MKRLFRLRAIKSYFSIPSCPDNFIYRSRFAPRRETPVAARYLEKINDRTRGRGGGDIKKREEKNREYNADESKIFRKRCAPFRDLNFVRKINSK